MPRLTARPGVSKCLRNRCVRCRVSARWPTPRPSTQQMQRAVEPGLIAENLHAPPVRFTHEGKLASPPGVSEPELPKTLRCAFRSGHPPIVSPAQAKRLQVRLFTRPTPGGRAGETVVPSVAAANRSPLTSRLPKRAMGCGQPSRRCCARSVSRHSGRRSAQWELSRGDIPASTSCETNGPMAVVLLSALKDAVGADAAQYLSLSKRGRVRLSDAAAFMQTGSIARKLGGLIQDSTRTATVRFGSALTKPNREIETLGPGHPAWTISTKESATTTITPGPLGTLPGSVLSPPEPCAILLPLVIPHELAHVDAAWYHAKSPLSDTGPDAVRFENEVRGRLTPGIRRTTHEPQR